MFPWGPTVIGPMGLNGHGHAGAGHPPRPTGEGWALGASGHRDERQQQRRGPGLRAGVAQQQGRRGMETAAGGAVVAEVRRGVVVASGDRCGAARAHRTVGLTQMQVGAHGWASAATAMVQRVGGVGHDHSG